eukprot:15457719-Alexandrium_andersonii.AAC.1
MSRIEAQSDLYTKTLPSKTHPGITIEALGMSEAVLPPLWCGAACLWRALQFEAQPNVYCKTRPCKTHPAITIEFPGVGMAKAVVTPGATTPRAARTASMT